MDECVFHRGSMTHVLCTNNLILAGPNKDKGDQINVNEMKQVKLDITMEGGLEDFLGMNVDCQKDGTVNLTQPHLTVQALKDLRPNDNNATTKDIPASASQRHHSKC
jgi:hypothetical protein